MLDHQASNQYSKLLDLLCLDSAELIFDRIVCTVHSQHVLPPLLITPNLLKFVKPSRSDILTLQLCTGVRVRTNDVVSGETR